MGHPELNAWLGERLGLSLHNFPMVRSRRFVEFMAPIPRARWDDQLGEVSRILSIPETHFARHPECFDAYAELLKRVVRERPAGTLRIWSAGSATGEEAYQLAAVAREIAGDRVKVFGTDMSEAAVSCARVGRYSAWSMRGEAAKRLAWLTHGEDGVEVDPSLRPLVEFRVGNLTEPQFPPAYFDLAFCRNVLIYFTEEGGGRVLDNIRAALRPGGCLITAPTDPVFAGFESFLPVARSGPPVRIYRRDPREPVVAAPCSDEPANVDLAETIRRLLRS